MKTNEIENIRTWFRENKRDFPWRQDVSAYHVWVSEIMLQQTQASVVINYYNRFMHLFPTIKDLAEASLDQVIKAWEGLGYYSRARNLHQAAQMIVERFQGKVPQSEEELKQIKGLGPYTIGAIRSFAFKQKATAVDGNVLRVLSRYYAIGEDITKQSVQDKFRKMTLQFLPDEKPWEIMEALIEIGALVCKKTPVCSFCPLKNSCSAYSNQQETLYPVKKKPAEIKALYRAVLVVKNHDSYLVCKGESGKIMADLYEFPYFELDEEKKDAEITDKAAQHLDMNVSFIKEFPSIKQSFTRYRATLYPILFNVEESKQLKGHEWKHWDELERLPFSAGHKKILNQIKKDK